ncbi:MAG: hypothetical protein QXH40_07595 [Candidatus Bathyarchaeia archaeon]
MRKQVFGMIVVLLMMNALTFNTQTVIAQRRVGVKVGDWIKYEYTTMVVAGGHPWVKIEVKSVSGTTVTVLLTMGPSGVSIPYMPAYGQTLSWDVSTGTGAFSFFIIYANAMVGDSVSGFGVPNLLQIQGEATRTYAGASRRVVYASYSSYGMQESCYWDKETGVLLEWNMSAGGIEFALKAVETNLWQAGMPLWIVGAVIAIIVAVTLVIIIVFLRKRKQPVMARAEFPPPPSPPPPTSIFFSKCNTCKIRAAF